MNRYHLAAPAAMVALANVLAASTLAARSPTAVQAGSAPAFSAAVQRQFQQALDQTIAHPHVPGAIVGVWVPGRGTWIRAAGLADRQVKRPTQRGDYTRIGSITKTFVGTLILQLVGEGKLGLDDPIQTWTPQVPNARHITVRELLNNTSGIFDYLDDPQWQQHVAKGIVRQDGGLVYRQHWLPQQLVHFATRHTPYFPPGRGYHYSNTNFILLGMILEKVTGQPLEELLQAKILRPLRLQHTLLPSGGALPSPHLDGYSTLSGSVPFTKVTYQDISWLWATGGMISTLDDLHTWAQALATDTLLSPRLQQQRLTWSAPSVADLRKSGVVPGGYGLAVANLYGFIGHNGDLPGFNTDAWYLPSLRATIVVIVNSDVAVQKQGLVDPADHLFYQLGKIVYGLQRAP